MGLTAARNTTEVGHGGRMLYLPVAAGVKIYDGALVAVNATGYVEPASAKNGLKAAGRAENLADNTNGADGDISVNVLRGVFVWENDTAADGAVDQADVLSECYMLDDCTVTMTATVGAGENAPANSVAGKVLGLDPAGVIVETL